MSKTHNINVLIAAISQLPDPEHEGQFFKSRVPSRLDTLNMYKLPEGVEEHDVETFLFVAVRYCRDERDCWYEWELVVS